MRPQSEIEMIERLLKYTHQAELIREWIIRSIWINLRLSQLLTPNFGLRWRRNKSISNPEKAANQLKIPSLEWRCEIRSISLNRNRVFAFLSDVDHTADVGFLRLCCRRGRSVSGIFNQPCKQVFVDYGICRISAQITRDGTLKADPRWLTVSHSRAVREKGRPNISNQKRIKTNLSSRLFPLRSIKLMYFQQ